jgi:hypothetical protein
LSTAGCVYQESCVENPLTHEPVLSTQMEQDDPTDPLRELVPLELKDLSDEELRAKVDEIRALRTSSQTWRAKLQREVAQGQKPKSSEAELKVEVQKKAMLDAYLNL